MITIKPRKKRALVILLTLVMAVCIALPLTTITASAAPTYKYDFIITSPYENVDWEAYGQYRANLHAHSTASDGDHTLAAMVEAYYAAGYDILGMADHGTRSLPWNQRPTHNGGFLDGLVGGKNTTVLTTERYNEILTGVGRDGRRMTQVLDANEQNPLNNHVLSYYTSFNTGASASNYRTAVQGAHNGGGTSVIAHPGRSQSYDTYPQASHVNTYATLLTDFPTLLGYEVSGKQDGETRNDRILWDRTLMVTAPQGRNVFGFANDDSHATTEVGRNWMMFLMPENTDANVRTAMQAGAFYSSSRYAITEGVDARQYTNNWSVPAPAINNITVEGNRITVEGAYYNSVEWIADGEIIATGNSINLNEYEDEIGSYIRFQLKGEGGISWSQPFLLEKTDVVIIPVVTHTVTFDSDGGSEVDPFVALSGEAAPEPAAPVKEGYTFLGWYLDGVEYDFSTPITADITLTANWEEIIIPITSLRIAGTDGQQTAATVTVSRNSTVQFGAIVNEGASTESIVWTISNTTLATVDANGAVSTRNSVGMVTLTARDAETGISHSITLRIS